jgi:hypothetical protein
MGQAAGNRLIEGSYTLAKEAEDKGQRVFFLRLLNLDNASLNEIVAGIEDRTDYRFQGLTGVNDSTVTATFFLVHPEESLRTK